jgi:two-component system, OmpR family, phosphate regulon response regulator PhoB
MKLRQLVLVVEPSDKIASSLRAGLRDKGFDATVAKRGNDALRAAMALSADGIVSNALLPDMSGAALRQALGRDEPPSDLPLVLYEAEAVARARYRFVIEPDLYASEAVSLHRFCQRVSARLKPRGARVAPAVFESGTLRVDTVAHRVFVEEREVALTALEFRLLVVFMSTKEQVLTREHLLRDVWGIRAHADTRTVDTNVKRLRQKLGPGANFIETVRNFGYRFTESSQPLESGARYAGRAAATPTPSAMSSATGDSPPGDAS